MRLIDEIAHRHESLGDDVVTDYYFTHGRFPARTLFKVTETATPARIIDLEVETYWFHYEVFTWRPTGWTGVFDAGSEHVDDATTAAMVAHRILTTEEV